MNEIEQEKMKTALLVLMEEHYQALKRALSLFGLIDSERGNRLGKKYIGNDPFADTDPLSDKKVETKENEQTD